MFRYGVQREEIGFEWCARGAQVVLNSTQECAMSIKVV